MPDVGTRRVMTVAYEVIHSQRAHVAEGHRRTRFVALLHHSMIRVAAGESGFLISPNRASAWSATDGETFHHCCKLGLEGIDAKRRDRPYRSGRSAD